jgi:hypothetical protein
MVRSRRSSRSSSSWFAAARRGAALGHGTERPR